MSIHQMTPSVHGIMCACVEGKYVVVGVVIKAKNANVAHVNDTDWHIHTPKIHQFITSCVLLLVWGYIMDDGNLSKINVKAGRLFTLYVISLRQ